MDVGQLQRRFVEYTSSLFREVNITDKNAKLGLLSPFFFFVFLLILICFLDFVFGIGCFGCSVYTASAIAG